MYVNVENVIGKEHYVIMSSEVPRKLRELRTRADVSMVQMARALDLKGGSSYQRYEDETLFQKPYLPLDKTELLADYLVGKGDPKITRAEVMALAGVENESALDVEALEIALNAAFSLLEEAGYIEFSQNAATSPAQIAGVVAHVCDKVLMQDRNGTPDAIRRGMLRALLSTSRK